MSGQKAIISSPISGMAGRTWKLYGKLCDQSTAGDRPTQLAFLGRMLFPAWFYMPRVRGALTTLFSLLPEIPLA